MFVNLRVVDGSISIHALLAESDLFKNHLIFCHNLFLSTLSLRRATQAQRLKIPPLCISIHALLAESDIHDFSALHDILISIHALLAESDAVGRLILTVRWLFLSTLSLRRATQAAQLVEADTRISIHALLAESDSLTDLRH